MTHTPDVEPLEPDLSFLDGHMEMALGLAKAMACYANPQHTLESAVRLRDTVDEIVNLLEGYNSARGRR
jgi:hypothetical protein